MQVDPVKDYLFDYLSKSKDRIQELISHSRYEEIIDEVTKNCYETVISLGERDEGLGVLATGLLHYLLTNALLSSQRKTKFNGVEIDIVIPDLKTLEKDPKKTLIIYIPKTNNRILIERKLKELETIQPEKQNIWLVLSEKMNFENKSYVIQKEQSTFSKIIYDIAQFVNIQGENKFKILKI